MMNILKKGLGIVLIYLLFIGFLVMLSNRIDTLDKSGYSYNTSVKLFK